MRITRRKINKQENSCDTANPHYLPIPRYIVGTMIASLIDRGWYTLKLKGGGVVVNENNTRLR